MVLLRGGHSVRAGVDGDSDFFLFFFSAYLFGSFSLRGVGVEVLGNNGSAGLIPWFAMGEAEVKSPRKLSSAAMKEGNPGCEHEEVMGISLLASVRGGETGTVWKRLDDSWSRVVAGYWPSGIIAFHDSCPVIN